jgi:predicted NAD/FAD-dependent oxidoreductase
MDVAIIGAGVAGLACARKLSEAGLRVTILDKGRGIGGRVATRRIDGLQFDHGAQHVVGHEPAFTRVLHDLTGAGVLAPWPEAGDTAGSVGVPGMSALPKALSHGLDMHLSTQITSVIPQGRGWTLHSEGKSYSASRIVLTVPAPQALALLGRDSPLAKSLASIPFIPCLTLLAATTGGSAFNIRATPEEPLMWIARDTSKPGRPRTGASAWVAQAGEAFSQRHLEKDPEAIVREMLPLLCEAIGASGDQVMYAAAHRWRYARAARPLGEAFLVSPDGLIYAGGDWCLGTSIEAAWRSGMAIAEDVLARAA